jgi:hypothetical protein
MRHSLSACLVLLALSTPAQAEPVGDRRASEHIENQRARELFQAAVKDFQEANYVSAARLFLKADAMVPSDRAISNAIASARRANDHLLVVAASERALERSDASAELVASGREALAIAARHLSRLELDCIATDPCRLQLDDEPVEKGGRYVLPGLHRVVATVHQQRHERTLETAAGATYDLVLRPTRQSNEVPRQSTAPPGEPGAPSGASHEPESLPAVVFWSASAVSVGLGALTAWSAVDTVSARNALPDPAPRRDIDAVKGRALRTDLLLIATTVLVAATTYLGVRYFGRRPKQQQAVPRVLLRF